ncbi:MAG: DUF4234 domain-containing protein [Thermoleophilia bacterium]|nr:DUF4234 domain-containing protein [Thermoleophilia bacterium]
MSSGPVGQKRGVWFVILIGVVTFGIYWLYWVFKTQEEMKKRTGEGLGGVLGLVVWLVVSPVSAFVIPSELGNMYAGDGKEKPVTGLTGLWLFPFGIFVIPAIVWAVKVQGSLNRYWDEAATPAAAAPSALPADDPAPAPASPVPAEAETGEEPTATDT